VSLVGIVSLVSLNYTKPLDKKTDLWYNWCGFGWKEDFMNSHVYNRIWCVVLVVLFGGGCALWYLPTGMTTPQADLSALVLMAISGVSIVAWFLSEPRMVLEAVALPVLARLERRHITNSPFWRRGRCSPEELSVHIVPRLRYCGVGWVQRFGITIYTVSIPNAPSLG